MTDFAELLRERRAEEVEARKKAVVDAGGSFKSDELKKRNVKVQVPILPAPVRDVPERFQELLDDFNRSTGEEIIAYYNPIAIPRVSTTVNATGSYTILDERDGRWELWRKIPDTVPSEVFERCQPCIILELGVYTRLWTIMDNVRHISCTKRTLKGDRVQVATIGDYREPDERDIRTLRWCDTARTPEGANDVMDEIYGKYNERKTAEAEREFDDLCEQLANYYWQMPNPIVPVGGGAKNQKADWRTHQGMER
jgi:hypothetical protein